MIVCFLIGFNALTMRKLPRVHLVVEMLAVHYL